MSEKPVDSPTTSDLLTPLSTSSENDIYDNLLNTNLHNEMGRKSFSIDSTDIHVLTDLKRISCFLAGEIEVPEDVPGWKVLYPSQPTTSKNSLKTGQKRKLCAEEHVVAKQKRSNVPFDSDIRIPSSWEACLLTLWEHSIKNSFLTGNICRDAFVERIRRIGDMASRSLEQYGFFTMKQLLGLTRATKLFQWARECWYCQRHLFRAGKLSSVGDANDPVPTELVRTDLVAWFYPDEDNVRAKSTSCPEVRLLMFYLDALIRSMGSTLTNRTGCRASITSRSWSALSVYQKQSNNIGYVSHYDNPSTLADGRVLTALYYLNPIWKRQWGGQLIIWPKKYTIKDLQQPLTHDNATLDQHAPPLAILPTLDRLVLFYADERTPHRVQPVISASEVDQRFALSTWYFDNDERTCFLRKDNSSIGAHNTRPPSPQPFHDP